MQNLLVTIVACSRELDHANVVIVNGLAIFTRISDDGRFSIHNLVDTK
jgi:hypothetical protein